MLAMQQEEPIKQEETNNINGNKAIILSAEQIGILLNKLDKLKKEGVPNTDDRYRSIVSVLRQQDLKKYYASFNNNSNNGDATSPSGDPSTEPSHSSDLRSPGLQFASSPVNGSIMGNSNENTSPPSISPQYSNPIQQPHLVKDSSSYTNVPISYANQNHMNHNNPLSMNVPNPTGILSPNNPSMGNPIGSLTPINNCSTINTTIYTNNTASVNDAPASYQPPKIYSNFTDQQRTQLRAQIYTFRKIIDNQPIPENYLLLSRGQILQPNAPTAQPAAVNPLPAQVSVSTVQPIVPPFPVPSSIGAPTQVLNNLSMIQTTPQPHFNTNTIRNDFNQNTPNSISIIPTHNEIKTAYGAPTPVKSFVTRSRPFQIPLCPVDPLFLGNERAKRLNSKFSHALQDYKNTIDDDGMEEEERLHQLVEIEKIKLLGTQHQLRKGIVKLLRSLNANQQDKSSGGRMNRKRSRLDRNKATSNATQSTHKLFLGAIMTHAKNFINYHAGNTQKLKKLTRAMGNYHTAKARKEQQIRERQEKERLKALKEDDEVAYLKLLEQTKNERLTQLLAQTNDYLTQIGARVREAKGNDTIAVKEEDLATGPMKPLNEMTEEEKKHFMAKEKAEAKQSQQTKTYYTIAHTIEEKVTEQPKMLVGGELKPYQKTGLQWLVSLYNNNLNGVLADEMGLGKTIQTIALLSYLIEKKGCNGPFLIIVPLSVLPNWESELQTWAPSIELIVYKGKAPTRKTLFQQKVQQLKFQCVLTTFEFVMRDKSQLSKVQWTYIIVDEGHRMKNSQCKLTTILSKAYKSKHRLLLTGTPLQNSIPELWSLLNFILPTIFNSVENFENWFSAPFSAAGERAEMTEEETLLIIHRLHKVLRPFLLRRLKQEVEDELPEKVEKILRCDFSAMQKRLYETMKDKGILLCDPTKGKSSQRGLMNTLMQLRKVCNHPYLFTPHQEYPQDETLIRSSGKFSVLDRLLEKMKRSGHRVLIFSQMTALMTILEDMLQYRGYSYLRLDGSTKAENRSDLLTKFNEKNSPYFVFILSTRAGGLGLNLQTADTVILFDSDWNPQMDKQAEARAHRIGQKNAVRVFRLVTINSVEEDILARANHKLDVDNKIIQAGMFNNSSSTAQRREFLMQLLQKEEESKDDIVPDDEQLNRLLARTEEEIVLFDQIDQERNAKDQEYWEQMQYPGKSSKLLQDCELPEWLLTNNIDETVDEATTYGRGMRNRSEVNYFDDGVDISDLDEEPAVLPAKRRRGSSAASNKTTPTPPPSKSTRASKKRTRAQLEDNIEESEEEGFEYDSMGDGDEEIYNGKRKSPLRAAKKASPVRRKSKRAKSPPAKKAKVVKDEAQMELNSNLMRIHSSVRTLKEHTGRVRSVLFQKLPSKRDYPDYYQIIKNPIDLKIIENRINQSYYSEASQFQNDMHLLVNNAFTYNIEGSQVYDDAKAMKELCDSMLTKLQNNQPLEEVSAKTPAKSKTTPKRRTRSSR